MLITSRAAAPILVAGLLAASAVSGTTTTAAATAPAATTTPVAPALHGRTLSLDGGALRVRPTGTAPRVHDSWAKFDLAHSTAGGAGFSTGRVVYGSVTLTARPVADPGSPGGLPTFNATPAWVLFFTPGASSCPASPATPAAPVPATASRRSAMVVDARTGAALVYLGAGSRACTPNRVPLLERVAEEVSVPWTGADRPAGTQITTVTADYPGCATEFATGATGRPGEPSTLGVLVDRAFGPCASGPRTVGVAVDGLQLVAPVRHAPVGPVRTGRASF